MEYPEGCVRGEVPWHCPDCPDKQRQACKDNYDILQAKKKAHQGKSNAQIHAEDNFQILAKKYQARTRNLQFPGEEE